MSVTSRRQSSFVWVVDLLAATPFIVLIIAFVMSLLPRGHQPQYQNSCANKIRQLTIAALNYESGRRRLPAAYTVDSDGRRLHSWRVELLPFMEEKPLYEEIRRDEQWNSDHNQRVGARRIPMLECPADRRQRDDATTDFVAVVDSTTAWPGSIGVRSRDFADGMSKTIVHVEASGMNVSWIEPRDLTLEQALMINDRDVVETINSRHNGVAHVTFADGATRAISKDIDPDLLRALLTRNGGEDVTAWFIDE